MVWSYITLIYDLICLFILVVAKACSGAYEYNPYSNTCLNLVRLKKSWSGAKKHCEDQGEYLVTLTTLESSYWLINMLKTHSGKDFSTSPPIKLFISAFLAIIFNSSTTTAISGTADTTATTIAANAATTVTAATATTTAAATIITEQEKKTRSSWSVRVRANPNERDSCVAWKCSGKRNI